VAIVALRNPKVSGAEAGKITGAPHPNATVTRTVTPTSSPSASVSPTLSGGPATIPLSSSPAGGRLPLVVLNNSTIADLARNVAQQLTAGGWTVSSYGNYQNDIVSTCAYYDPTVAGAQAAAEALQVQFPAIQRVEPQFSGLSSYNSPIVLILTAAFQP
jgi:hypothetical protein